MKPWLIGEVAAPTAVDLLREVVYAEQGSPQQAAAVEAAWLWLNRRSVAVEVKREIVNVGKLAGGASVVVEPKPRG